MKDYTINLKEHKDETVWIHCGHIESMAITLVSENPSTFFVCCTDCYHRLLGYFISCATEVEVKLK